ncbi:MAG TPA: DUF6544 family protein [Actinomycetes bacterium]|nr:DUF6544 family protein [Actinomycetes bacterium]
MRAAVPVEVERRLVRPSEPAVFTDAELDGLPDPVCRYLRASIAPGTPLATAARLGMRGQIKLGRWLPFQAEELLAPHQGFHWAARAARVVSGFDRYVGGQGQMRWRLLGLLPVMRADGPDLSRSAAGRVAGEAMWMPTALLPRFGVDWSAVDDHHLTAGWRIDSHEVALELVIDDQGRLRESVFQRWGDPDRTGTFGLHPCGGEVTAYATFGGMSVPGAGRAGWFYGTDRWAEGEFFRYQLTSTELVTRPRS